MFADTSRASDASSRGSAGFAVVVVVFGVFLLPALYVLSVGPADYLVRNDRISREAVEAVYGPLIWLYRACEPIRPFFDWYLEWWQ